MSLNSTQKRDFTVIKQQQIIRYFLAALLSLYIGQVYSAEKNIYLDADTPVSGISQNTYVNMWWQWAVSMPRKDSPVSDRIGTKCAVNQAGPVWFLAGGYGSSLIQRKCTIPSGKYIFFPIINMVYYPASPRDKPSCSSVKKGAAMNNNHLISFKVIIDKHKYVNPAFFRHASEKCFDLYSRVPGAQKYPPVYPSATDGYWVMVKPLSKGKHEISFRAEYNSESSSDGHMVQDISYSLNIK